MRSVLPVTKRSGDVVRDDIGFLALEYWPREGRRVQESARIETSRRLSSARAGLKCACNPIRRSHDALGCRTCCRSGPLAQALSSTP